MRALGRVLLKTTGVLMRRGNVDTGTHRGTPRQKIALYLPRSSVSEETNTASTLNSDF